MKKLTILMIFLLTLPILIHAQKLTNFGLLKRNDEVLVYGFKLRNGNKIALLCRQKNNGYLVYRFGTIDKVELQYPAFLNSLSWKRFRFNGYWRGGSPKDVLDLYSVMFMNNGIQYKIYQNDSGEDDSQETGIIVKIKNKEAKLIGSVQSETGALSFFNDQDNLLHNYYWDDQK